MKTRHSSPRGVNAQIVMTQIERAKADGLLPDGFIRFSRCRDYPLLQRKQRDEDLALCLRKWKALFRQSAERVGRLFIIELLYTFITDLGRNILDDIQFLVVPHPSFDGTGTHGFATMRAFNRRHLGFGHGYSSIAEQDRNPVS
jgi:hypothetical protein